MSKVTTLFQELIAPEISSSERLSAYRQLLSIANSRSNYEYDEANLLLGHFYSGLYGNPIPQNCPIPSLSLAEPRYINVCLANPNLLEASVALAHLYCRAVFNAYIGNNIQNIENYRTKLLNHLHNIRLYYINRSPYGKDLFETLHNVLTSKNCESLKLSQNKCNLIWLLTTNYYLMADHFDYEMAKKCLDQFKPVADDSAHNELMIVLLEQLGLQESLLPGNLGRYIQNICGGFIKIILPSEILIKKSIYYQREHKTELAYWYAELAATALENDFYKNAASDKKNEIVVKLKEICALFPEMHNIKHILKHILGLKNIEQLHDLLITEYPISLPLHKAILSETIICAIGHIKANREQQSKSIALLHKHLLKLKSLFPDKDLVNIFAEVSSDIHKYHHDLMQNDIYLVYLALARYFIQLNTANYDDVLKCFRRCLSIENVDHHRLLITLEQCKKHLIQKHRDEFVDLLTKIALRAFDPTTGKNVDIKHQVIDTILELKTTDDLLTISEKCKLNVNSKEELWYAEIAVRGLYKIKLSDDKHRLEIFKKIESIAKNYPASLYMKDKLLWARGGISSQAMIANAARKAKKDADNKNHISNDSFGMIEDHLSTMKIAQR